ncbi:MAG: AAA family ATPase, partial [Bdellovibrionales bacterium]|nr:AAA family ATPase [Bdellovibrionales bacterium]
MKERAEEVLVGDILDSDKDTENKIRPQFFEEFAGQTKVKDKLQVFVAAAKQRNEPLDHTLLCGPPGLGKTTLAYIISHSLEAPIMTTSGPALNRKGDLAALLTSLQPHSVLFIDEIHRL